MDQQFSLFLKDTQATRQIGYRLGKIARNGDVILLHGDLGAGKTTLTQAIAVGLNVPAGQYVTSPSFALMHEYPGRMPLYHMDCYRLSGEEDVEGAGLIDYIGGPGLTVIEWPDRLGSLQPVDRLDIELQATGEMERICIFQPHGSSWTIRIRQLFADEDFTSSFS
jgi:tRNA threonylcarbamoyladenosine biosynthesis protein TsaE